MQDLKQITIASVCAIGVLAALSGAVRGAGADSVIAAWLGTELTIVSSALEDHIPANGKFTLVYDSRDDVYRACTRNGPDQKRAWQQDWASPCAVTFQLVKSQRYCTLAEVKAGNGETLASCHRLRSREVAMHAASAAGAVELHDTVIFPLQGAASGSRGFAMLIDSPARMTHGGLIHIE